jgi:hypothetical protein
MHRVTWLFSFAILSAACSGDDAVLVASTGHNGAGRGGAAADGGRGGELAPASEGTLCDRDDDCQAALRCRVADRYADAVGKQTQVSVCARACDPTSPSCEPDEVCASPTNDDSQALCFNLIPTLFDACGARDTSFCGPTSYRCLALDASDVSMGICVQPCALPGSKQITGPCPTDMSCRDELKDPNYGVCLRAAARGERCGLELGMSCADGDLCIVNDDVARCYQDCSVSRVCDDGKSCKLLGRDEGYYCN